jgi:hypothetical protein
MELHPIWLRLTSTRYTRALEAEVARLRAENRALLNSILGIAGVPPIPVPPDSVSVGAQHAAPTYTMPRKHAWRRHKFPVPDSAGKPEARTSRSSEVHSATTPASNGNARDVNAVTPMRRRSWHQIYRMLEIDSARKKPNHLDGQAAGKPQEATNIPPTIVRT